MVLQAIIFLSTFLYYTKFQKTLKKTSKLHLISLKKQFLAEANCPINVSQNRMPSRRHGSDP